MPIQVMTTIHAEDAPVRTALVAMLLVLLGLILAVSSGPAAAQSATGDLAWQVVEVSGDVRVRTAASQPSPWRPLIVSDAISAKAEIDTGGDGRAVLAHDGSRITISPNSQLMLPDHVPSGAIYRVVQRAGTMLFKIIHATKDKFQVETPYLTTVIKGTTFSVSVNAAGGSVHVTEGAVMVRPLSGEAALVTPGQTARVPAGSRGGVIINGRNGNGGSNGRTVVPAADRAEKANEPAGSQGAQQAADKTQIAKPEGPETGKTQDSGKADAQPAAARRSVAIIFETAIGKPTNGDLKVKGEDESTRGQGDAKASRQSNDKSTAASSAGDAGGNAGRSGTVASSTGAAAAVVANTVDGATSSNGAAGAQGGTVSAAASSASSGNAAPVATPATAVASGSVGGVVASNSASALGLSSSGNGNANGLGNGNGNAAATTVTNAAGGALSSTTTAASSVNINTSVSVPTVASITVAPGNSTVVIGGNANGLAATIPASLGTTNTGNGNGLALGHSKKF